MDVIKKDTPPIIILVPRIDLDVSEVLKFRFTNEFSTAKLIILSSTITALDNGTYSVLLEELPDVKIGDKFSYTVVINDTGEVVSLGKLIILAEDESIQDYTKASTNKFYK